MDTTRRFDNERLKEKSTYILRLLLIIGLLICLQFLYPVIKPQRYSGSSIEWIITIFLISIIIGFSLFHIRFVSILFDDQSRKVALTTVTLISGAKTNEYNYSEIAFGTGKDPGSLRKKSTLFVNIYNGKTKLIRLERVYIGEETFDNILREFQRLENQIASSST